MKVSSFLLTLLVSTTLAGAGDIFVDDDPVPRKPKPQRAIPFHGKLTHVDLDAGTIKVGKRSFELTESTRIMRGNKKVSMSPDFVGERVGGAYRKSSGGTLKLVSIRIGKKPENPSKPGKTGKGKQKKPAKDPT